MRALDLLLDRVLVPFQISASESRVLHTVAACRVLVGVILCHQALDSLGFADVVSNPAAAHVHCNWILVAASCVIVGFLTPAALLTLLIEYAFFTFTGSLGDLTTCITLWGLVLFGAGRSFSIDSLLCRWRPLRPALGHIYLFALDLTPRGIAAGRFLLMNLFWGLCFGAMLYHTHNPFWCSGKVLQIFLVTAYYSDHYEAMAAFRDQLPRLFQFLCVAGLAVQGLWETFLVPLMYFRFGRRFVAIQGVLFFVMSLVFLNLQYLPLIEFCLWGLLFGPSLLGPTHMPAEARSATNSQPASVLIPAGQALAWAPVMVFGISVAWIHTILSVPIVLCTSTEMQTVRKPFEAVYQELRPVFSLFGQSAVDVFNETDLEVGRANVVLYETDSAGKPQRIVPFMDAQGGRLDYLRNDLLYFCRSLLWQRSVVEARFEGQKKTPTEMTQKLVQDVALLDARLTGQVQPRLYTAVAFERDLLIDEKPIRWSASRAVGSWSVSVKSPDVSASAVTWPVFDLPPGHIGTSYRERQTIRFLTHDVVRQ